MGWSSGATLLGDMVEEIEDLSLNHDQKVDLYKLLIENFENYDCDNIGDLLDDVDSAAFVEAYRSFYPDEDDFWDEEE